MTNEPALDDQYQITITPEEAQKYKRLDVYLVDKLENKSRNFIKKLYSGGLIQCQDRKIDLKKMPPSGSIIEVQIPPPIPSEAKAEDIPLEILYEDEHLLFVNKVAGMVTHPAPGHYSGTLVNAILHHCNDLSGIGQVERPGIVHRLDKGTSGIMVVAKTQQCHEALVVLFSKHNLLREYEALCVGDDMVLSGRIDSTLGRDPNNRLKMKANIKNGKNSTTHFEVLQNYGALKHVKFTLETGRTHQIRVHASQILRNPLLNDFTYANVTGQKKKIDEKIVEAISEYEHPFLHARTLELVHPITREKLSFRTPPPQIFQNVLQLAKENK